MLVSEGMSEVVLTVGPSQSLAGVAELMAQRNVGSAVVLDPDAPGPGIVTERDILRAIAGGVDASKAQVAQHCAERAVYASPGWSLEQAAEAMVSGGFRHLIVIEGSEIAGVLSMRDIVSCWVRDGASCDVAS
ncbi:MAG: CBS domain-containing protein [Thermoleophilaceae bacterium]|nr:CBS domain-containing protein [Thermoleophilaceae bacterium]